MEDEDEKNEDQSCPDNIHFYVAILQNWDTMVA